MNSIYRRLAPYGVAIVSTGIAVLLSFWFQPILDRTIGAFFYIAVIVSASYGGIRAGIVATLLSAWAIDYIFISPAYQVSMNSVAGVLRLGIFILVASVINVLSSNLQLSRRKVEKLNQQLLRESRDRLNMALSAAHMGLWDWNLVTGEIVWSPEHEQLFGLAPGGFDGRYETFEACIHPDDLKSLTQTVQTALQGKMVYQHEYRVVWADGSVHWLEGRGQVTYDHTGQAVRMTGTVMSIDHRKQAELALINSEQQLRAIFDAEPACVKVITADGILKTINSAGLAIVEADSVEAAIGQCIFPLIDPNYQQIFREFTQQVAAGQPGMLEFAGTGHQGTHRWLETHAVPLPSTDATPLVLAVTQDITERKQAELALQQLMEDLEQRVAKRTAELSEANDRLQKELFQRERIERALQESELKFHAMFDQSRLFIGLLQPDGTIFEVNQRPHELTEQIGEVFVGRPFWELAIWGRDQQSQMKSVIERARAGEVVCLETDVHMSDGSLLRMPNGNLVTLDIRVKAVRDEVDQVMFLTAEGWDISDRKQAEAALRQSEERFRSAFEDAAIGMTLVGVDGRWLRVNQAMCDIVGYSTQELLQTDFQSITYPDDLMTDLNYAQQLLNNEIQTYQMEKRYLHKQGHIVWALLSVSLLRDEQNQPLYFISQIQNISKRKQSEAALQESNRRWRSLLDDVQLVVIGLDINGCLDYANPFFLNLTGYTLEEVLGQHWFEHFLSPGQRQSVKTYFREGLEHNRHAHYQNPILTRSGEERMIAWNNTILRDAAGHPIGTVSIGEDITERYRLERMKAEFISVVSHELRTPLTSMQAALSLLVEKIIDPNSEEGETIIQIAAEGVDRLVRLVNDILDLERLDSGRVRLEKRLCNTAHLIATATDQMQEMANQAGVTLNVMSGSFEITADPDRLLQVLTNLLSNAIKFSPSGSVLQLSVALEQQGKSEDSSPSLLFTIQDQGRGIPAHKLETIFERFQQVDTSDSREKGGTGLGLAICRTIIEQHGGRIWAKSQLEQGSTFYFTLPFKTQQESKPD